MPCIGGVLDVHFGTAVVSHYKSLEDCPAKVDVSTTDGPIVLRRRWSRSQTWSPAAQKGTADGPSSAADLSSSCEIHEPSRQRTHSKPSLKRGLSSQSNSLAKVHFSKTSEHELKVLDELFERADSLCFQSTNAVAQQDYKDDILTTSICSTQTIPSSGDGSSGSVSQLTLHQVEAEQQEELELGLQLQKRKEELETARLQIEKEIFLHNERMKEFQSQKAKLALEQGGGPEFWGITVEQLVGFTEKIKHRLRRYCAVHRFDADTYCHVCCDEECQHDHGCADYRCLGHHEDLTLLSPVEPNMHTVVQLFIKPLTKECSGMKGLALTLNDREPKKVEVFVSHSWSGRFEDFVDTLDRNLLPHTSVFVCSFALPQNLDVAPILSADLEMTPFAKAHRIANEVLLVVDKDVDVIERVWVVYELYLTLQQKKPILMGLSNMAPGLESKINDKLDALDVRSTKATKESDLRAIRDAIAGKEDMMNSEIHRILERDVHRHKRAASLGSELFSGPAAP